MAAISAGEMPNNRYIPRCPNEETHLLSADILARESVPSEVKHLSSWRKRKHACLQIYRLSLVTGNKSVDCIPLVVASESGAAQTISVLSY